MNRVSLPYVTTSQGISVFDSDNQYRPQLWMSASNEIEWLNREDNGLLLTLVEKFSPNSGQSLDQPIYRWTEESRLDIHTTLTAAINASATTVALADPRLCVVNTFLFSPADGEIMRVDSVDYTNSTVGVTRGVNGTARVAKASGDKVISLSNYMAELSDPNQGNGRLPGEAKWNCISIVSQTFKVSKMQENSMVKDGWGQASKAAIDTMLDVRRQVGKALLFQARSTYETANDGQMYIGQGIYHYIKSGMLDLGEKNSNLTWPIMNAYLEARFEPDASSQVKQLIAGQYLFNAIQRMVRDTRGETVTPYFEPALGTMVYRISTDGGYIVEVMLDKYGLAINEGLGDWGFLLDMAHIEGKKFNGMDFQWLQNIQSPRSVMYREDCFLGSFSVKLSHESLHGIIRGAGKPIMVNRV